MPKQVVIIGAGIAGLTAGILLKEQLRDQDINITIYEQRTTIRSIGGGLSIWPNGAKVLMSLPCASDIKKLAQYFRSEYWGSASGDTLRVVDRDLLLEINGAPFLNICRSELQDLLLKTFGEKNVVYDHKVTDIKREGEKTTIYFNNNKHVLADLVIGADGAFSTVRKLIFPEFKLDYAGYVALVGIYDSLANVSSRHNVIWGKNRLLLNFPISNNRHLVYTILPLPKDELKTKYPTREQQFELFKGWSNEADNILLALRNSLAQPKYADHYYCSENNDMSLLPAVHSGNIVLIGDAAHPMGSIMGLNANMALEDAHDLVHHISTNANTTTALEHFSRASLPRIKRALNLENEKKTFFLDATINDYINFTKFASTSSHKDFFNSLYVLLQTKHTNEDDKKETQTDSEHPAAIVHLYQKSREDAARLKQDSDAAKVAASHQVTPKKHVIG